MRNDLGLSSGWSGKMYQSYNKTVDWRDSVSVDWKKYKEGEGMRVLIIGSGIDDHQDLRRVEGYNLSTGNPYTLDDSNGHSTFVAGIIAGTGAHYVKGIAPKTEVSPVKVFAVNNLTDFRTLETALLWAVDNYASVVLVDVELYNTLPYAVKGVIADLEKDGIPIFINEKKNGEFDFNKFDSDFANNSCWVDNWYKKAECIENPLAIAAGLAILIKEKFIDIPTDELYSSIDAILFPKEDS
jgi:subtilisin family serine protease